MSIDLILIKAGSVLRLVHEINSHPISGGRFSRGIHDFFAIIVGKYQQHPRCGANLAGCFRSQESPDPPRGLGDYLQA